jgi:thiamine-phosphate pyrophosphorylase
MSLGEARAKLGHDKIIGVSCYGDISRAIQMQRQGADYVAFGSFFPSKTKPQAEVVSPMVLMSAKDMLDIPICAIGGITDHNAKDLVDMGADMVAVISDLWQTDDLSEKLKNYKRCFVD